MSAESSRALGQLVDERLRVLARLVELAPVRVREARAQRTDLRPELGVRLFVAQRISAFSQSPSASDPGSPRRGAILRRVNRWPFVLVVLPGAAAGTRGAGPRRRCARGGPPTRALAWRAGLVGVTPVRRYLARPDPGQRLDPAVAEAVLVLAARADERGRCWLQVQLPTRPNGARGWVNAARVRVRSTPWRIEVSRARRAVALLRRGRRVLRVQAVIGTAGTPTPTGRFAIISSWRNPPRDFLGAWILPLTAHSDVLDTYDGGDGRVALHGRGGESLRDPLGSAASHGCVRLANAAISRVVRRIGRRSLAGTPVRIG